VTQAIIALAPIAAAAAVHAIGRTAAVGILGMSSVAIYPSAATMGTPFIGLALGGIAVAATERRARPVAIVAAAIALQTAALLVLARTKHAAMPYMALKMCYLAIYPGAVGGAIGVRRLLDAARPDNRRWFAWAFVAVLAAVVARQSFAAAKPVPVVSDALYDAGRWTRTHLDPACVDYLVADDDTAYWLHLAVLGNARAAPRSVISDTYEPKQALIRWVLPGGLPYALVGKLDDLPNDIRSNVDVVARFGEAAVVKRRGASSCH
jgi:asparagine N-glycosylation enzyme membrane subunit Stt3